MAKKIWGGKKITEIIKDATRKHEQIDTLHSSARETVNNVTAAAKEASEVIASINANAESARDTASEIEVEKEEIQELKQQVEDLKNAADELVTTNKSLTEESKKQLAVIAGGSLSNDFETRRSVLGDSALFWFRLLLVDIAALIIIAVVVFVELKGSENITVIALFKFSLAFPFIYAAFFFQSQYKKERDLEEEYAFKSVVSFSLESYRKLISEEIDQEKPEERIELIRFMVETVKRLYSPPRRVSASMRKNDSNPTGVLEEVKEILKIMKEA